MPDTAPDRTPWRAIAIAAAAIGLVVLMAVLGALNPPVPSGVSTDRLGPERGEPVADYLARAHDSLASPGADDRGDTDEHWALVSFTETLTPDRIPAHGGGLRIAQVIHQTRIPRVHTPIVTVAVPAGDAAAVASADNAAWQLLAQPASDERFARVVAISVSRLRAGCACTIGIVVRGSLPRLRELSTQNGIRAVQALPADAVSGRFAVVPLPPDQNDVVAPGPDDGPLPER
ncbi:hypothetical protein ACLMAJ_10565 [Nocardia sp. KC 131]|uniref:hypothetical protein n=1 Tax=Nocardia arseniciresistens TaxID=3392119 RepID=UPI00398E58CE